MQKYPIKKFGSIQELLTEAGIFSQENLKKIGEFNHGGHLHPLYEILQILMDAMLLNQKNFDSIFTSLEIITLYDIKEILNYLKSQGILIQSNFLRLFHQENMPYIDSIRMVFYTLQTHSGGVKNLQYNFSMICKNAKYAENIYSSFQLLAKSIADGDEPYACSKPLQSFCNYRSVGFSQEILDSIYKNPQYAKRLAGALFSMEEMHRYGEEKRKVLLANPKYSAGIMCAVSILLNDDRNYHHDYSFLHEYQDLIFKNPACALEIAYALRYLKQYGNLDSFTAEMVYENTRDLWGSLWLLGTKELLVEKNKLILKNMPVQDLGIIASSIRILANTWPCQLNQTNFEEIVQNPNHAFFILERLGINLGNNYNYPDSYIEEFMEIKKIAWVLAQGKYNANSALYTIPIETLLTIAKYSTGFLIKEVTKDILIQKMFAKYLETKKLREVNLKKSLAKTDLTIAFLNACVEQNIEGIDFLLLHGADINAANLDGNTCLHIAAKKGFLNLLEHLVRTGANIYLKNTKGETGLNIAFINAGREGDLSDMKRLLQLGADINATDENGKTVFHFAAASHNKKVCEYLIECGIDYKLKDKEGNTAFMFAAFQSFSKKLSKVLISRSNDKSSAVRANTIKKLGLLKNITIEILEVLFNALYDVDKNVRLSAFAVLSNLLSPKSMPVEKFFLSKNYNSLQQYLSAPTKLKFFSFFIIEEIIKAFKSGKKDVVKLALLLLNFVKISPEIITKLLEYLPNATDDIKEEIFFCFENMEPECTSLALLTFLFGAVRDSNENIRNSVSKSLGCFSKFPERNSEIIATLTNMATGDPDEQVRNSAVQSLRNYIGLGDVNPAIIRTFLKTTEDDDEAVVCSGILGLGECIRNSEQTAEIIRGILKVANNSNEEIRKSVITALGKCIKVGEITTEVLGSLLTLVEDPSKYVMRLAILVLGKNIESNKIPSALFKQTLNRIFENKPDKMEAFTSTLRNQLGKKDVFLKRCIFLVLGEFMKVNEKDSLINVFIDALGNKASDIRKLSSKILSDYLKASTDIASFINLLVVAQKTLTEIKAFVKLSRGNHVQRIFAYIERANKGGDSVEAPTPITKDIPTEKTFPVVPFSSFKNIPKKHNSNCITPLLLDAEKFILSLLGQCMVYGKDISIILDVFIKSLMNSDKDIRNFAYEELSNSLKTGIGNTELADIFCKKYIESDDQYLKKSIISLFKEFKDVNTHLFLSIDIFIRAMGDKDKEIKRLAEIEFGNFVNIQPKTDKIGSYLLNVLQHNYDSSSISIESAMQLLCNYVKTGREIPGIMEICVQNLIGNNGSKYAVAILAHLLETSINTQEIIDALLNALGSDKIDIRNTALGALTQYLKTNNKISETTAKLIKFIESRSEHAIEPAVLLLCEQITMGKETADVIYLLTNELENINNSINIRTSIVSALGKLIITKGENQELFIALCNALKDTDARVREFAASQLCRYLRINVNNPEIINHLLMALDDENSNVRLSIVWLLSEEGQDFSVKTNEFIIIFLKALNDKDELVCSLAISVLGKFLKNCVDEPIFDTIEVRLFDKLFKTNQDKIKGDLVFALSQGLEKSQQSGKIIETILTEFKKINILVRGNEQAYSFMPVKANIASALVWALVADEENIEIMRLLFEEFENNNYNSSVQEAIIKSFEECIKAGKVTAGIIYILIMALCNEYNQEDSDEEESSWAEVLSRCIEISKKNPVIIQNFIAYLEKRSNERNFIFSRNHTATAIIHYFTTALKSSNKKVRTTIESLLEECMNAENEAPIIIQVLIKSIILESGHGYFRRSPNTLLITILKMRKETPLLINEIIKLLWNESESVRMNALLLLSKYIKKGERTSEITEALGDVFLWDNSEHVRCQAAIVLGICIKFGNETSHAIDILIYASLQDSSAKIRKNSVLALVHLLILRKGHPVVLDIITNGIKKVDVLELINLLHELIQLFEKYLKNSQQGYPVSEIFITLIKNLASNNLHLKGHAVQAVINFINKHIEIFKNDIDFIQEIIRIAGGGNENEIPISLLLQKLENHNNDEPSDLSWGITFSFLLAINAEFLEEKDSFGNTALMLAVFNENVAATHWLLKKGANIEESNNAGETPLLISAKTGNKEIIGTLLACGADYKIADHKIINILAYHNNEELTNFVNNKITHLQNQYNWGNFHTKEIALKMFGFFEKKDLQSIGCANKCFNGLKKELEDMSEEKIFFRP